MGKRKCFGLHKMPCWKHLPCVASHCATMQGNSHPMQALVKCFSTPDMSSGCYWENKLIFVASVYIWLTLKCAFFRQEAVHSTAVEVSRSLPQAMKCFVIDIIKQHMLQGLDPSPSYGFATVLCSLSLRYNLVKPQFTYLGKWVN